MKLIRKRSRCFLVPLLAFLSWLVVIAKCSAENSDSPETLFRQAVSAWRQNENTDNEWLPWYDFAEKLQTLFFDLVIEPDNQNSRLEIVGGIEEAILIIERSSIEKDQRGRTSASSKRQQEETALSVLYATYGSFLMNLSPSECLGLAMDAHTLLIGAERVKDNVKEQVPDTFLCRENAENALRNAMTLDATNSLAEKKFRKLTQATGGVHERKPKEFVAELFDSFADSFDEKLLGNLEYRVPEMVGRLAKKFSETMEYRAVLDAGCGTGLAGRYLRPIMESTSPAKQIALVGVDASQKMLDRAALCTTTSGCGLEVKEGDDDNAQPLYDKLLNMDLEDVSLANSLRKVPIQNKKEPMKAYDLVVAADVLVYFGSLENILETFSQNSKIGSHLIFSCELATDEEAPLGWRLLPSGRFAHTKQHAMDAAYRAGYTLIHYEEIVPRTEKGEPVRGHLFGFVKEEEDRLPEEDGEL